MAEFVEEWLRSKRPEVRDTTFESYARFAKVHIQPTIGGLRLIQVNWRHLNALYEELQQPRTSLDGRKLRPLGQRSVAYVRTLLNMVFEDALRKRLIVENPVRLADHYSQPEDEARWLNPDELRAFQAAVRDDRFEPLFTLLVHTGLRIGEALGLRWQDVDLRAGKLSIRQALKEVEGGLVFSDVKTKSGRRTISLGQEAVAALKRRKVQQAKERLEAGGDWCNEQGLVFTEEGGGPQWHGNIRRRHLRPGLEAAGVDPTGVGFHTLRHTHASLLIAAGVPIHTVSRRLGHRNVTITLRTYAHLLPGMDEAAAEAMDELAARF